MSHYSIQITRRAAKELARIAKADGKIARRISDAIKALAAAPRPDGVKKLTGTEGYRIRVGEYRVLYTIDDGTVTVVVFRVRKRGDAY